MTMVSMVVGAVTNTSARFTVKVTGGPIRIKYSVNSNMSSASFSASTAVDAQKVASVTVSGLSANTRYYWQVEDNSVVDTSSTGQVITDAVAAGATWSTFTIGASGDAGSNPAFPGTTGSVVSRLSNHPVFSEIATRAIAENWRRMIHMGDLHYYDLGSGNHGLSATASAAQYRGAWDDVLAQANQAALYRSVGWVYVWDDHDYGPNNADGTFTAKANAASVYRERAPSYTLPAAASIYHSFEMGRILFIVSDTRYNRDPNSDTDDANKTFLGSAQKSWMDSLLASSTAAALVWVSPSPWLHTITDGWAGFTTERAEMVQMFTDNGWLDRMICISADHHCVAFQSADMVQPTNNLRAYFPVFHLASFDATPTVTAVAGIGPMSGTTEANTLPGRGQYGTLTFHDTGSQISVTVNAWQYNRDYPIRTYQYTFGGKTPVPRANKSHAVAL